MPSPINAPAPVVGGSTTLTTTAETVLATLPSVSVDTAQSIVVLTANVDLTTGTGSTALTLKVRRGSTVTGTEVQAVGPIAVTEARRVTAAILAVDKPGFVTGEPYCVTGTMTGASGNSTSNSCVMTAEVQAAA